MHRFFKYSVYTVLFLLLMGLLSACTTSTIEITFDSMGGTAIVPNTIIASDLVTIPTTTKDGHTFDGWYTSTSNGLTLDQAWDFTVIPNDSITLYAKWVINAYAIHFDSLGGQTISDVSVNYQALISEPSEPNKEGYTFDGWYTSNDQGVTLLEIWDFSQDKVTSDLTLYAKWILNEYIITYVTSGGTTLNEDTVHHGDIITLPSDPEKLGYSFDGWYIDESLLTVFDEDTLITTDLTLYAKWEPLPYEIALITDSGTLDDHMYNQGAWEGIMEYATEHNIGYMYYMPETVSNQGYMDAIDLAIANGAKIVVAAGFLFENSIYYAQHQYPDIHFVIIDGSPHNVTNWSTMETFNGQAPDFAILSNTTSIFFQEEQAGFLAGYATMMEGYDQLGFMGGMQIPAVIRFGTGFIAGAYYAALDLGMTTYSFNPAYYTYVNTFGPSTSVESLANSWYQTEQLDAIFVAAGHAGQSVIKAAESYESLMIGVDFDQSHMSDTILTSAMKRIDQVVYQALEKHFTDTFMGGTTIFLGASNMAVGLPLDTSSWRFETFTIEQYNTVLAKLENGSLIVPKNPEELEDLLHLLGFYINQTLIEKID